MLRCFHYSVGSVHDLRRNRALVVYQYCKCHKRWLAFAENFWKNLHNDIWAYGIAFFKKRCKVVAEKLK